MRTILLAVLAALLTSCATPQVLPDAETPEQETITILKWTF
jgi:type IV pilus biogenesis protein CpaD/CtpE